MAKDFTIIENKTAPQTTSAEKLEALSGKIPEICMPKVSFKSSGAVTASAIEIAPFGLQKESSRRSSGFAAEDLKKRFTVIGLMIIIPIQT